MDSRPKRSKSRYVDVTRLPTGSKTVFVVMGVLMALGVLMLLKLFRSTPKGFRPDVRMSALDKVQALSLTRTARRESEAGRLPEAVLAWQGAIATILETPSCAADFSRRCSAPGNHRRATSTSGSATPSSCCGSPAPMNPT